MHERALLENAIFDVLLPWRKYHPRTFFDMISAIADKFDKRHEPINLGEIMRMGTGTVNSLISSDIQVIG